MNNLIIGNLYKIKEKRFEKIFFLQKDYLIAPLDNKNYKELPKNSILFFLGSEIIIQCDRETILYKFLLKNECGMIWDYMYNSIYLFEEAYSS